MMLDIVMLMFDWLPPDLRLFCKAIFVLVVLALFIGIILKILQLIRG